jgi:type III secretion system HrpE/YscL family protein
MSLVILHRVDGQDIISASASRIERGRFESLRSAADVLRAAKLAAAALREDSERVLAAQAAEAREAGFQQGLADAMLAVMGTLETERRLRQLLADRLADVVEQCVRSMLGDVGDAATFKQRVRHLLRNNPSGARATLHVCPAQVPLAQAAVAELAQDDSDGLAWLTIFGDEQCAANALVLETRVGFVDASLELTLAQARDVIGRAVQGAAARLGL